MLRRVENAEIYYKRSLLGLCLGRKYRTMLQLGRKEHLLPGRVHPDAFRAMKDSTGHEPVRFAKIGDRQYWLYQSRWHWDSDDLSAADVLALLTTRELRKTDTLRRAQSFSAAGTLPIPGQRTGIPADVRAFVFRRDGGACQDCGSQQELQFDHVIPVSLGGASTAENVQLLCGPCNRRKSASV